MDTLVPMAKLWLLLNIQLHQLPLLTHELSLLDFFHLSPISVVLKILEWYELIAHRGYPQMSLAKGNVNFVFVCLLMGLKYDIVFQNDTLVSKWVLPPTFPL